MKDARGHGSNGRGASANKRLGDRLTRAGFFGKAAAPTAGDEQKRLTNLAAAGNAEAAKILAQGHDKSGAVPTHDAHSYNPGAVNDAIAAQNRSGRGRIGGKEASAIHRLLKGRH